MAVAAALLSLALLVAAAEVALRIYHLVRGSVELQEYDELLGWRPRPDVASVTTRVDAAGAPYLVTFTTDERGLRTYRAADRPAPRPRILVVGDSFTFAEEASDHATYTARLGARLGVDVFALAGGGWGTLQQCLALEQTIDAVRPDLVLWQLCTNDFVNNDLELERRSSWNNNGIRRPYLGADGRVEHATPKAMPWVWDLRRTSRLARAVLRRIERIDRPAVSVEEEIIAAGADHPDLVRAVDTTRRLLARGRSACGGVPVVAFCAEGLEPFHGRLVQLCRELGVPFLAGVPEALATAEAAGTVTRAADRVHWGEQGHAVVAEALAARLGELGLLPPARAR